MVVGEWRERHREKFSPFSIGTHLGDYLRNEAFVVFLRVLLVENAVPLLLQADASKAILTTLAHPAIEKVAVSAPAIEGEEDVGIVDAALHDLVHQFAIPSEEGKVVRGTNVFVQAEAVAQIFAILNEEAVLHVLRIENVISGDVFGIVNDAVRAGMRRPDRAAMLGCFIARLPGGRIERRQEFPVFLFGILLVECAELLMGKIDAAKAVLARITMGEKGTVAAILAEFAALEAITMLAHRAVVAQFGGGTVRAIQAIFGLYAVLAVHGVFRTGRIEDEIAISDAGVVVAVIAILRLMKRQRPMRDLVAERLQLRKE